LESRSSRELIYLIPCADKVFLVLISYVSFPSQLSCAASSRAVSPLVVPGDFSQPASPFGCLDNSAAKHKLGLRLKAYNKRKPARVRHTNKCSHDMN